jgi:hypothetical protein
LAMEQRSNLVFLAVISVVLAGVLFIPVQNIRAEEISGNVIETKCLYAKFLSLGKNCVIFNAPFAGTKNDELSAYRFELYVGDFLRFPETEEAGEIIKVVDIKDDYAIIEYMRYAAPIAPNKQEKYEFKIYK